MTGASEFLREREVKRVFVDSGGFFALLVSEDQHHGTAVDLFKRARQERWSLVTADSVVVETYALLLSRVRNGRDLAVRFLDSPTPAFARSNA